MINLSYFWISAALRPLILFWLIASTTSNAPSYSLSRIRTSVRGEHAPRAPRKFQAITNLPLIFACSLVHVSTHVRQTVWKSQTGYCCLANTPHTGIMIWSGRRRQIDIFLTLHGGVEVLGYHDLTIARHLRRNSRHYSRRCNRSSSFHWYHF